MVPHSVPWQAIRPAPHEEYLETSWRRLWEHGRRCRCCDCCSAFVAARVRHGRRNDDAIASADDEPSHDAVAATADANAAADGHVAATDADAEPADLAVDGPAVSSVPVTASDEPAAHVADAAWHATANDAAVAHDDAAAYDAARHATTTRYVDANAARNVVVTRDAAVDVRLVASILPTTMKLRLTHSKNCY